MAEKNPVLVSGQGTWGRTEHRQLVYACSWWTEIWFKCNFHRVFLSVVCYVLLGESFLPVFRRNGKGMDTDLNKKQFQGAWSLVMPWICL